MQRSPATVEVPRPDVPVEARPPFSVRGVVARNLSVWTRHGVPLFLASLVVGAPSMVIALARGRRTGQPSGSPSWLDHAEILVAVILVLAEAGALTLGALQALRGERPRAGALIAAGLRSVPRVAVVALGSWLAVILGAVALVVPGIVAATALYVAVPAAVAEPGLGAVAGALRRSWRLTRQRRFRVFALGLLALAVVALVMAASMVAGQATGAAWYVSESVAWILTTIPAGVAMTLPAVAYHDLRLEKEGASADALGAVFG